MTTSWKWIIGLLMLVVSFWSGWIVNGWRYEKALAVEKAKTEQATRAVELANAAKLKEAEDAATQREQKIRADADSSRNALEQLRKQLASYTANDTNAASIQRTGTVAELFADCAGKYRDMAETADRLDNDRRKLRDGWPEFGIELGNK